MNIFIEKFEKSKSPFLEDYNRTEISYLEKNQDEDPFNLMMSTVIEGKHLSQID